jgi:hypothetical protein
VERLHSDPKLSLGESTPFTDFVRVARTQTQRYRFAVQTWSVNGVELKRGIYLALTTLASMAADESRKILRQSLTEPFAVAMTFCPALTTNIKLRLQYTKYLIEQGDHLWFDAIRYMSLSADMKLEEAELRYWLAERHCHILEQVKKFALRWPKFESRLDSFIPLNTNTPVGASSIVSEPVSFEEVKLTDDARGQVNGCCIICTSKLSQKPYEDEDDKEASVVYCATCKQGFHSGCLLSWVLREVPPLSDLTSDSLRSCPLCRCLFDKLRLRAVLAEKTPQLTQTAKQWKLELDQLVLAAKAKKSVPDTRSQPFRRMKFGLI